MQHRQAGFIRNYSSKQIPVFQQEPSEFSYFRPKPHRDETDEFSPYKFEEREEKRIVLTKPPLPHSRGKGTLLPAHLKELPAKIKEKVQGEQVYNRLKQHMVSYEERKDKSKEKLQENIGHIRNKIQQLDYALKELKQSKSTEKLRLQAKVQKQLQAELNSSSSSSSQSEEIVVNSIPSPKLSIQRINPKRQSNLEKEEHRQANIRQSNERSNSYSQRENIVTFNSRTSNHPPLQIRDYSSSEEQEEVPKQHQSEHRYEKEHKPQPQHQHEHEHQHEQQQEQQQQSNYLAERGRQMQTRPIQRQQMQVQRQAKGVYKNKGGVCFDIDTRQFTQPIPPPRQEHRPIKKPKVDKRSQVLRRRQTAKAYDRKTRKALFTTYQ